MPSAVDTVTFQNKKYKAILAGSATQAESAGDFVLTEKDIVIDTAAYSGVSIPSGPGINFESLVTTTPVNSMIIVTACASIIRESGTFTGTIFLRILDGTTILKTNSFAQTSDTNTCEITSVGIPNSGTRTYNFQVWNDQPVRFLTGCSLRVTYIQLTDTHTATSKNTNIING